VAPRSSRDSGVVSRLCKSMEILSIRTSSGE